MTDTPRLLERANAKEMTRASTLAATLAVLNATELVDEYDEMMEAAPRRGEDGYRYFVERTGRPPQGERETRREERLAMALVNDQASIAVDGESIDTIMYAFPLYTSGGPKGTRAVDFVGHASKTRRLWVGELKLAAKSGYGETPLRALYEALVYGAIVEANLGHIASELVEEGRMVDRSRPGLLIAAPSDYWKRWTPNGRIGDWWTPYLSITRALSEVLGAPIETLALGWISYRIGPDGRLVLRGALLARLSPTRDLLPQRYPFVR